MEMQEFEDKLVMVIAEFTDELPADQITELVKAGEPGIALENFCTQLYEYDVVVSSEFLHQIAEVGSAMGIDRTNWVQLMKRDG